MKQLAVALSLALLFFSAAPAPAGEHPRLDRDAEARCPDCHDSLLAGRPSFHPPVAGGCAACAPAGEAYPICYEPALCLACHAAVGELAEKAKVSHAALAMSGCTPCHTPDASSKGGGACLECHDDMGAGSGESIHAIVEIVGCHACHEPHGGSRQGLLRETGAALCLSCHDPGVPGTGAGTATVRLLDRFQVPAERRRALATLRLSADGTRHHPVVDHRVLGALTEEELRRTSTTFKGGELTCLSCHDPHKGRYRLLRWGAGSAFEACLACHSK